MKTLVHQQIQETSRREEGETMAQTMAQYLIEQGERRGEKHGETQAKREAVLNCCSFDSIPSQNL